MKCVTWREVVRIRLPIYISPCFKQSGKAEGSDEDKSTEFIIIHRKFFDPRKHKCLFRLTFIEKRRFVAVVESKKRFNECASFKAI